MDVFEALADSTRRALLRQLANGSVRVVDLASEHPVSRPAISRHLRVLGEAGLVQSADHGRERHYALVPEPLAEVRTFIAELFAAEPGRTQISPLTMQHLDALDTEVRRTSRERRRGAITDNAQRKETG